MGESEMSEDDIYVIVADNDQQFERKDGSHWHDDGGPLVFEQYTSSADYESTKRRADRMAKKYGRCRIAKLTFIEE